MLGWAGWFAGLSSNWKYGGSCLKIGEIAGKVLKYVAFKISSAESSSACDVFYLLPKAGLPWAGGCWEDPRITPHSSPRVGLRCWSSFCAAAGRQAAWWAGKSHPGVASSRDRGETWAQLVTRAVRGAWHRPCQTMGDLRDDTWVLQGSRGLCPHTTCSTFAMHTRTAKGDQGSKAFTRTS